MDVTVTSASNKIQVRKVSGDKADVAVTSAFGKIQSGQDFDAREWLPSKVQDKQVSDGKGECHSDIQTNMFGIPVQKIITR